MNIRIESQEQQRINALKQLHFERIGNDPFLQNITELAARLCKVEFAAVTCIDKHTQIFVAKTGLKQSVTPRKTAFCNKTIQGDELFQVNDTWLDSVFRTNPFVIGEPYIRFYAGYPLKEPSGYNIGALCVIGDKPGALDQMQRSAIKLLAEATVDHLVSLRDHRELERVTNELKNFFMLSPDMLGIISTDGYFKKVSAAFIHKLGYSETEIMDMHFTEMLHPEDLEKSKAAFERIRNHAERVNFFRNRFKTKSGKYIWLSWNAIPDKKSGLIYTTARDVTEIKKLEHELENQIHEKQKASDEKIVQLTNLTGSISNEIMKPLNLSLGFTDISLDIISDLKGSPTIAFGLPEQSVNQLQENLTRIRNYNKSISDIISHMNEIKWYNIGEPTPENHLLQSQPINRICSESLQLALSSYRTVREDFKCTFGFKLDHRDPRSRIHVTNFSKSLISILYNAFDAMMHKAAMSVNYTPKVTIETKAHAKELEIRITNNGLQIPEKIRDKIFNPFFTTKDNGDGLGLGLTISYNIIKSLSGSLTLEASNKNETTFRITLPLAKATVHKRPKALLRS